MSVISSMMVTLLDDYDYHGITIRFSGDYSKKRIYGVDYQLPVFKIDNPNAAKSCGCGSSFSVDGETYDSCGGCGYK